MNGNLTQQTAKADHALGHRLGTRAYTLLQAIHIVLIVLGVPLLIMVAAELVRRIDRNKVEGLSIDGDLLRGPFILIVTILIVTLLAFATFLLLRHGKRWACWADIVVWSIGLFPLAGSLEVYWRGFGIHLAVILWLIGLGLALATFFLIPPRKRQQMSPVVDS